MGLGSGIQDPEKKSIPDPGVKKAPDPGSGSKPLAARIRIQMGVRWQLMVAYFYPWNT